MGHLNLSGRESKMKSKLFLPLLLLMIGNSLFAQQSEISIHLFGGISAPDGDYIKKIDEFTEITKISGLNTGDKIGLAQQLNTPVWVEGLFWTFTLGFFVNGVDGSDAQSKFRSDWGDSVAVNLEFGSWINIPVLTGFRYDLRVAQKLILYGIGEVGVNISKPPSLKATIGDMEIEDTKYLFARDFSYGVGIGLVYNQTYNIGLRYLNLGTARYNGTRNVTEQAFPEIYRRTQHIIGEQRSVSMYIFTVGIQLFP
jgi:hypothetical protein